MGNTSITLSQRGSIEAYLDEGFTYGEIGKRLNHPKSGIWYEVQRMNKYNPDKAQHDENVKRSHCGRHTILTGAMKTTICNNLKRHTNPKYIAKEIGVAVSSLYNWIYNHWVDAGLTALPEKGKRRRRKKERRGHFPRPHTIEDRPDYINQRLCFGDWEADTVLSPHNGDEKAGLVTFVERKTRFLWSMVIPDRSSKSFAWAMKIFMNYFGPYVHSITTDNGREFSNNYLLEKVYGITFYFCDAYAPEERGTNERMNRKMRQFFPKPTNFSKISQDEVFDVVYTINSQPMEILNGQTAIEAFRDEINHNVQNILEK